jgi:DNA-binding NarL/FixJ family response regulator
MTNATGVERRYGIETNIGLSSGVDCVVLSCFVDDIHFLAPLLGLGRIRVHRADTLEEADFLITATAATVLATDLFFLDGSWRHALEMLRRAHPLIATIVLADAGHGAELSQGAEFGVFAICPKPLKLEPLRAAIQQAHQATLDRIVEYIAAR